MPRRLLPVPLLAVIVLAASVLAGCGSGDPAPFGPVRTGSIRATGASDPLAYTAAAAGEFQARAAAGLSNVLYQMSPGGLEASIQRTEAYRPLIQRTVARTGCPIDADTLEALVLLESAGRPEIIAGNSVADAAGLTQIVASTGQTLLGMHINLAASERITAQLGSVTSAAAAARLVAQRAKVDPRFDPADALAATCHYLKTALATLGRPDLALESYHMGIGNLQRVLTDYGHGPVPYVQLYFATSPAQYSTAWNLLYSFQDDSSTYLWRVYAARAAIELYRRSPKALAAEQSLQVASASSEVALHPPSHTDYFGSPSDLAHAEGSGEIVGLPAAALARDGIAVSAEMGAEARQLHQPVARYRGLQPGALALLGYLGAEVRQISGASPLELIETASDGQAERLLGGASQDLETTGWAFDIARSYRSPAQALAFQYELDRLSALDLIAWVRLPNEIHVTVASDAAAAIGHGIGAVAVPTPGTSY
ncbi:MAG TPA: transglycosylase SLT domain-containing protein [Solirubrobacteraceae bacterium]|nr:transglycosylase SLT domain-containing protein [Solirubrobacteraceae bacterium]